MKVFKNANEFNKYINAKKLTSIGYGSEGVFYQSLVDGMGYKILYPEIIDDYKPNNIIVASEVETNGFIFPIELFVVKGKLVGYKTNIISFLFMILILKSLKKHIKNLKLKSQI